MAIALEKKFESIGAKLHVKSNPLNRREDPDIQIDTVKGGFKLFYDDSMHVDVLDFNKETRHLLMLARKEGSSERNVRKFLAGHDERDWFVAEVRSNVKNVNDAMMSLKPSAVRDIQKKAMVKTKDVDRRKNKAYVRQGEWFFVPTSITPDKNTVIHKKEPFRRGRGKEHVADEAFRVGGDRMYVFGGNALKEREYKRLVGEAPDKASMYVSRTVNARLFVRGKVRHPDHSTVELRDWCEVIQNSEQVSKSVFFFD